MARDWRLVCIMLFTPVALGLAWAFADGRALAFLAAVAILFTVETVIALRTPPRSTTRGQAALVQATGIFPILGFGHAQLTGELTLPATAPWVAAGLVLVAVGASLRFWALLALGRWFVPSVSILEGQPLVRTGPYALTRHPGYVGFWLGVHGLALVGGSIPALLVASVCATLWVHRRVREEEAALRMAFGREWDAYASETLRFFGRRVWR